MVFNNTIMIRPFTNLMIVIDRFGKSRVIDSRSRGGREYAFQSRDLNHDHDFDFDNGRNYGDYGDRDHNYNDRDSRWGDNDHKNRNGRIGGRDGQWDNHSQDSHEGRIDHSDGRGYNDNGYNRAMNDFEFNRVLASIKDEWRENNKLKSATQVVSSNYFTTAQVKEMLQLFSTESIKLELAKQAYSKTVDQKNYFMINEVFSFNSSKDELTRFIRTR